MKLRNKQQILDFKEMKKLVANDVAFISSRDLSFLPVAPFSFLSFLFVLQSGLNCNVRGDSAKRFRRSL